MLLIMGIFFIICGLLIHKFKLYWLIAGYNTMSKEEKSEVDITGLARSIGIMFYLIAAIFIICSFFKNQFPNIEILAMISMTTVLIIGIFRAQKYNYDKQKDKSESIATLFIIGIPLLISLFIIFNTISPIKIELENDKIIVEGSAIKYADIKDIKIINKFPQMSKSIGSGIGSFRRGTYKVNGLGSCTVYTDSEKDPILKIKTSNKTILVNSKSNNINDIYTELSNKIN